MKPSLALIILVLTSLLGACQKEPNIHQDSFLAFGTIINVTLVDVEKEKAIRTMQKIREDFAYMHRVWHVWQPSPLKRINQLLETTAEFSAAPSVLELINVAKTLSVKSQHLFNPAAGKLIALWGFHQDKQEDSIPSDTDIARLVAQHPSMNDVTINGVRMKSSNPAVKIDLGGIAKGFAIERILKELKQDGIHNALINTGGDLKVIGQHGDRPWHIGVRHPRQENAIGSLELKDNEAVFTSGDYERYLPVKNKDEKKRYHHIIDPRTGYPATETQAVTVLHHDATTADAAATALLIAGPDKWKEIARAMGIKNVMLIDKKGQIHITPSMKARIKFEQEQQLIVSEVL